MGSQAYAGPGWHCRGISARGRPQVSLFLSKRKVSGCSRPKGTPGSRVTHFTADFTSCLGCGESHHDTNGARTVCSNLGRRHGAGSLPPKATGADALQGSSPANQGMPPGLPNSRPLHPLTREKHLHVDPSTHICLSTAVFTLPYSGTGLQLEALQPWAHTGPHWGWRPIHQGQESSQKPKGPSCGKMEGQRNRASTAGPIRHQSTAKLPLV